MRIIFFVFPGVVLFWLTLMTSLGNAFALPPDRVGGPCTYDGYPGQATITRIEQTEQSKDQAKTVGGPGYEGYEVLFSFTTDKEIKQAWAKEALKKEHLLDLRNSWYPGEQFLKKYGLVKGKVLKCTLKAITSGTCTPVVFEFDEVNTIDYFETKLPK
jgi:hypothetical protein